MPLDDVYFEWLYSQVGSVEDRNRSKTYWKLLTLLYKKEFTWSIPRDENRAQDGKDLRREFLNETETRLDEPDWLDMPCSVLEFLIALSFKLAWEADGGDVAHWFWVLIDNLGLTECTDVNPPEDMIIDHILNKVMDRQYAANGAGGLFPLNHAEKNQTKVEIWYQAQSYLLERV